MYYFLKGLIFTSFSSFLCFFSFFVGLCFLWATKKRKIGEVLIVLGFLFLLVFSLPFLPNFMLGHLERKYPAFETSQYLNNTTNIKYVVVLASGHVKNENAPITSQFLYPELMRLIEGIRLYYRSSGVKLILSGGKGVNSSISDAELMRELSIALNVPERDIIVEPESMSTYDEAKLIKPIVDKEKFLLITSASHMPRSMALFKKQGMNPVAAPTDFLVRQARFAPSSLIPAASNIMKADVAFYEYFGLIKEKILRHI